MEESKESESTPGAWWVIYDDGNRQVEKFGRKKVESKKININI